MFSPLWRLVARADHVMIANAHPDFFQDMTA
jgi:hypothetical protein